MCHILHYTYFSGKLQWKSKVQLGVKRQPFETQNNSQRRHHLPSEIHTMLNIFKGNNSNYEVCIYFASFRNS